MEEDQRPNYIVEPVRPDGLQKAAAGESLNRIKPAPPDLDVMSLASRPASSATLLIDFDGHTVGPQSIWYTYTKGAASPVWSLDDRVDTNWSQAERDAIYNVYLQVSEDFAPFNVNVTTLDPGSEGMLRDSLEDQEFGARIVVTRGGPVYSSPSCDRACGGIAAGFSTWGEVNGGGEASEAWFFTVGSSLRYAISDQAVSHEAGHIFGLQHDGEGPLIKGDFGYSQGADPWSPIMGVTGLYPITQWSKGEYRGANNREDDVAILESQLGMYRDERVSDPRWASELTTPKTGGLIGLRDEGDAFLFRAQGLTRVTLNGRTGTNVDLKLSLFDARSMKRIAALDPKPVRMPYGIIRPRTDANFKAVLPRGLYVALVQSVGTGDPLLTPGAYTRYGSMGRYRLAVRSRTFQPQSLKLVTRTSLTLDLATATSMSVARAEGGEGKYKFSADGLPQGLKLARETGLLTGTSSESGTYEVLLRVQDEANNTTEKVLLLTVS